MNKSVTIELDWDLLEKHIEAFKLVLKYFGVE
jgi:hypothetical protein